MTRAGFLSPEEFSYLYEEVFDKGALDRTRVREELRRLNVDSKGPISFSEYAIWQASLCALLLHKMCVVTFKCGFAAFAFAFSTTLRRQRL